MEAETGYPITEASPKAQVKITTRDDPLWAPYVNRKGKYPIGELKIGDCFIIPLSAVNDGGTTLRTMVYKWGKRLNRKFAVIKHTDQNQCYEVARIG